MRRIIALDISLHSGFAIMTESPVPGELPTLEQYGTLELDKIILEYGPYPWCYIRAEEAMVSKLMQVVTGQLYRSDIQHVEIVVEETNLGSFSRYSQKVLEGLHCQFLLAVEQYKIPVHYIDSSAWRSTLNIVMTKEDKKNNAKLSKAKKEGKNKKELGIKGKITKKHLAVRWVNETYGLDMKQVDNNTCDAIALGSAFLRGAPTCDGT